MAGERYRLVAEALHEATVAGKDVSVMVDQVAAVTRRHQTFAKRHAGRVREPLAERTRRRLDTEGEVAFGMARRLAAELAEAAQLVERHAGIAGQIEQRVQQHRAVPVRQHETVAVGPCGRRWVEFQMPREQHGRNVGHAHGHPGMARVGLFDRVHGQRPNGVGHIVVTDRRIGHGGGCCHGYADRL